MPISNSVIDSINPGYRTMKASSDDHFILSPLSSTSLIQALLLHKPLTKVADHFLVDFLCKTLETNKAKTVARTTNTSIIIIPYQAIHQHIFYYEMDRNQKSQCQKKNKYVLRSEQTQTMPNMMLPI